MRSIKTFVLHFYVDPETPDRMCGDLRLLQEKKSHSFKTQLELDELLRRLVETPSATRTSAPKSASCPER